MAQTPIAAPAGGDRVGWRAGDVLLLLAYAVLALWWVSPPPRLWATHSAYDPRGFEVVGTADFYLIVWVLSWVAHAIWRSPLHLFDANTFFPAPLSLAYSEHLIGFLPLFGPVYWLTGNPILALNVTAFLTYPLSAWFTYLYARRYVGRVAAAVSGLLYAFCAARYLAPPHFHMLGAQYLPLVLYGLDQWLARARARDAALLAVALLLLGLSSVYLMYAVAFVCAVAVPFALVQHSARLDRRRLVGLGLVAVVVGAASTAVMLLYLTLSEYGLVPDYDERATALGLIPAFARIHLHHYLASGGVGWIGYVLALVGALPGGAPSDRWARRLAIALALLGLLLALGPGIATAGGIVSSPYALLMEIVPGFATVRMPTRFTVIAQLGFSLLAGLGVARLGRRHPVVAWGIAVACTVLVLATRMQLPEPPLHRETVGDAVPPEYRWLAAHGEGRAVLEVPRAADEADASRRAYLSTFHWNPIVDGYGAYPPQHRRYLGFLARRLPEDDALQQIVDLADVGWIVVHRDQLTEADAERWRGPLPAGLVLAAEWPSAAVYEVRRPVREDRRALLLSREQTLRGTAIAPLGDACPGELRFVGWASGPIVAGRQARVQVRIENRSSAAWPAAGFYPRGLVQASFVVRNDAGLSVGLSRRTPLNDDPRPFEPSIFSVAFRAPREPGRYALEVELVQHGVKRLKDCGLAPLVVPFEVTRPDARPASDRPQRPFAQHAARAGSATRGGSGLSVP
jgi:hypothetical protein